MHILALKPFHIKNLDPLNSANLVDLDSLKSVVKVLILTSNNNELLSKN